MVSIPTAPNISCGIGQSPVAVVATYAGGLFPIPGAKVSFKTSFLGISSTPDIVYTDTVGIAQMCFVISYIGLDAYIQKDNIDFGNGVGKEKYIGNSGARISPYIFPKVIAKTSTPGGALPPPTVIASPKAPTLVIPELPTISPPPAPEIPTCSQLVTTVESGYPSHPSEITDFLSTFYIYIRGVREVCKSDPTNPKFGGKLPKGTPGTVTLGNLSTKFYLEEDGIMDIDLSKLINLSSLAGVTGISAPPVVVVQPTLAQVPVAGERVGSYCTLSPYQAFGQTWYKVVHDTIGQISSGDTYSVAKHKAETELRCFPKPTIVACVTITGEQYSVRGKNVYYRFKGTPVAGMYAEGSWRDDTATPAQNKERAITTALAFYNRGYFQRVYGRDMKRTDICGQ